MRKYRAVSVIGCLFCSLWIMAIMVKCVAGPDKEFDKAPPGNKDQSIRVFLPN